MKIAGIQFDMAWEDPSANFPRLEKWIGGAVELGAELVVLPEMFACGFSMNTGRIAEPKGGASTSFLQEQARKHGIWLAGSLPELPEQDDAEDRRPTNTLVLAHPNGELDRYHKIHPFTYAGEHEHYRAGESFLKLELRGLRFTFFICYDLRFADEFWVNAEETDVYVVVANWPEARRHHWQALLTARAIENQAWVVGINRVGQGGSLRYTGDSAIIDPLGRQVAYVSEQEGLLAADIDPTSVSDVRAKLPFLQDRR